MSDYFVKALEWINEKKLKLKIESVNSYLQDVIEERIVELEQGFIKLALVDNGDMKFDDSSNTVILFDNTDYWFTYNIENKEFDEEVFEHFLSQRVKGKGVLNSKNYVGILDIGKLGFEVIVKSKKINYDRDFNYLKESITNFCEDLLSRSGSFFGGHFCKKNEYSGDKINYSELAFLKEKLQPVFFPSWVDYLLHHAEHRYIQEVHINDLVQADHIIADFYLNALLSDNVFRTNKVQGKAGKIGYAPSEINSFENNMTYDTNENRFVKYFVWHIYKYISDIIEACDSSNMKLKNELIKMNSIVEEKLKHPFWKNISDMESIPFNSQILHKKYPYNLIFQMYTDFTMKSAINLGEIDKSFVAGQKDVPMLYQYWVFIMLFTYLSRKYDDRYVTSDWVTYDGNNLTFTLKEGSKSFVRFIVDDNTQLILLYNKTYDKKHAICEGRSYSHELKPDISIEMFKDGELVSIIHFDAKYKIPMKGTDVPDDLNKMHTYKDGIMGTVGSFAICLADEPTIYHEEEYGWEKDGVFPAVGTCPLNLNPGTLDKEMEYIFHLIDEFTKIDAENKANRYSKERLKKYNSLSRILMEIKE